MQNFRALGAPPPHPRASGGWGLCPQTPSLQRLGASPPDPHWPPAAGGSAPRPPKQPPPLRISGYAPERTTGQQSKHSSQAAWTWMTSDSEKSVHVPVAEDAIEIESSSDE